MQHVLKANLFEGFLCNDKTQDNWEYEEGELEALLAIEEKQNIQKHWWQFWK